MKPHKRKPSLFGRTVCLVLCMAALLSGCGGESAAAAGLFGWGSGGGNGGNTVGFGTSPTAAPAPTETRPNQPVIRTPSAPGTAVVGAEPLVIDVSNAAEGYVMARYNGTAAKASIQITGPDQITYKYFLKPSEKPVTLPLTGGSGTYALDAYENIQDTRYAVLYKETLEAELNDELLPFLYPNVYVDFTAKSEAVARAQEIVAPAADDLEAVELIYHYVVKNITYDTPKAETVTTGYLPVVDETLRTGKGICFDYAALTAAMLRSQDIPTKLEIGYAGSIYHAWISVYTEETGWIDRIIEFSGDAWTRLDPTFASGNNNSTAILQYIGDGTNYKLQYSH